MLEDFCRDFTKLVNEELKNTVISNLTTGKPDSEQGGVLRITQTFSATRANSEVDYRRDFIRLKRENRIVFVVCQAPADQWPDFSSSCNQLLQSLK